MKALRAAGRAMALILLVLPSTAVRPAALPGPGDRLPDFTLVDLDERPLSPRSLAGKVVSVHFIAIWCDPCLQDLPVIEKAASRYVSRGYQPLLVAVGHREDLRQLREFAQKRGLDVPILFDARGEVEKLYGIGSLPTHLIAARDGQIRRVETSLPADYLPLVGRLVEEKAP